MVVIRTRSTARPLALLAALALAASPLLAGCEIAPSQTVCQVAMSPESLGIVITGGKVSGIVTVACDQPVTSINVSARLVRDPGSGSLIVMGERDFHQVEPDGNYEVTAPCVPGRWRFSYSVSVTANGENKKAFDTSDVTEVHPSDC
jgi:hypothetical protein